MHEIYRFNGYLYLHKVNGGRDEVSVKVDACILNLGIIVIIIIHKIEEWAYYAVREAMLTYAFSGCLTIKCNSLKIHNTSENVLVEDVERPYHRDILLKYEKFTKNMRF